MERYQWPFLAAVVWAVCLLFILNCYQEAPFVTWSQMVDVHMAEIIKEERGR